MKSILNLFGVVLFTGLLFLKASAFHVYEHHDTTSEQENQCELCLVLMESQQADVLIDTYDITDSDLFSPFYGRTFDSVEFQVVLGPLKTDLFSRPPPSSI